MRKLDERGSVSGMFFVVVAIIFVAYFYLSFNVPIANGVTDPYNTITQEPAYGLQDDQQNSMLFLQQAMNAAPWICLILILVSYLVVSLRERYSVT